MLNHLLQLMYFYLILSHWRAQEEAKAMEAALRAEAPGEARAEAALRGAAEAEAGAAGIYSMLFSF